MLQNWASRLIFAALPAILVPRHTITGDNNEYPLLDDISTSSVPENTNFPGLANLAGHANLNHLNSLNNLNSTGGSSLHSSALVGSSLSISASSAASTASTMSPGGGQGSAASLSPVPPTETPPPGYMSEDGENQDHNDNLSKYFNHYEKSSFLIISN